jgi:molybdopterin-guanine dinucleotide biosynthesis protein A
VTTYDAILPAGGRIDPEFAQRVGTDVKALIDFGGRTILDRTLDALEGTGRIGRTILVGDGEIQQSPSTKRASQVVGAGNSGPDTILRGLKALLASPNPPDKVLIVTTDMPFLEADHLTRFLDSCPKDRDICIPLITKEDYQARFPDSTSTFIPLKDASWTAGGAYLVDVGALQRSMPYMERVFQNRKSKLGMAKLLGPVFLFRFLTKSLTVPLIEAKVESILGCTGAAVLNCHPELAYDVDFLDDYEYALKHQ